MGEPPATFFHFSGVNSGEEASPAFALLKCKDVGGTSPELLNRHVRIGTQVSAYSRTYPTKLLRHSLFIFASNFK